MAKSGSEAPETADADRKTGKNGDSAGENGALSRRT